MLDKTIKEAYTTDVAIHNSHNRHSTVTEKLYKYTDLNFWHRSFTFKFEHTLYVKCK